MAKSSRFTGELIWSRCGILIRHGPDKPAQPFLPAIGVLATVSVENLSDKFVVVVFRDYAEKLVTVRLPRAEF